MTKQEKLIKIFDHIGDLGIIETIIGDLIKKIMKVKVGNKIYDGEKEPIMLILTDRDKLNITHMNPKSTKYAQFPNGRLNEDEINDFMGD